MRDLKCRTPARRLAAAVLLSLVAGCASSRVSDASQQRLLAQIRGRGLDPATVVVPFQIDAEMRAWLDTNVQTGGDPERRLEQLLKAVLNLRGRQLSYQRGVTRTAREVWETNRANCLSFCHLYAGLARELGLAVYYLRVFDLESFEKDGDLVVVSDHVTVGYGPANRRRAIDFIDRPIREYHITERMTDMTAIALHYSNLGAERIRDGAFEKAESLLQTAVRLDPHLGDGWVNLGVALRRLGRASEAEAAFRRAIETNPRLLPAYNNLAALLDRQGRSEESRKVLELTDRRRNRNPFTFLALGDQALSQGRLQEAEKFFRRAQRLHPAHAEPLAALGQWALAAGRCLEARRWLEAAQKIDPADQRAGDLARTLRSRNAPCDEPVRKGFLSFE